MTIYKFTRPTLPPTLEKQRDVLDAFRTLVDQDDELIQQRRAEIAAIRRELEDMRRFVDVFRLQARELRAEILKELKARKYSPDQPRVPAGSPRGGEWTSGGAVVETTGPEAASQSKDVQSIIATARGLNVAVVSAGYEKCLDLCYLLLERFQPAGSDRNKWDFHKCMNACLGR